MGVSATSIDPTLSAFAQVYREHHRFVWRTLRGLSVPESALDDAMQDVFMVVHRRLDGFEGRAKLRTWIYEIVRRVAWRYRSNAQRDATRNDVLPELRGSTDLDAALDRTRAFEVLGTFTATLDEDRLRVFVLSEFGQLRGREIAETLGVNINTVYARLRSAHAELERLSTRMRARESRTLVAAACKARPRAAASRKVWSVLVLNLQAPTALTLGGTWLAGLRGAGLRGAGLRGAGLRGAGLRGAGLRWAGLRWAGLRWAGLRWAGFRWVGLGWAGLGGGASALALAATLGMPPRSPPDTPAASSSIATANVSTTSSPADTVRPQPARPPVRLDGKPAPPIVSKPRAPSQAMGSPATPTHTATSALAEEVKLVQQIRRSLGDETTMGPALRRYAHTFPNGSLRLEVEALEIEHRCLQGLDVSEQRQAFSRQQPNSALTRRLDSTCARPQITPQKPARPKTQRL